MNQTREKIIRARDFFAAADSGNSAKKGDDWENFDFSRVRRNVRREKPDKKSHKNSSVPHLRANFSTIFFSGAIAGAAFWMLFLAIKNFVIFPLFCGAPDGGEICAQSDEIANLCAAILVGVVLAYFFAMKKIPRGDLVALATTILLLSLLPNLLWRNAFFAGVMFAVFGAIAAIFFAKLVELNRRFFSLLMLAIFLVIFWIMAR